MDYVNLMKDDFVVVLEYLSKKEKTLNKGCMTSSDVLSKFLKARKVTEEDVVNCADLQVATISYIMEELRKSPKETVMAMESLYQGKKIKDAFLDSFLYNLQTQECIFFSNVFKNALNEAAVII